PVEMSSTPYPASTLAKSTSPVLSVTLKSARRIGFRCSSVATATTPFHATFHATFYVTWMNPNFRLHLRARRKRRCVPQAVCRPNELPCPIHSAASSPNGRETHVLNQALKPRNALQLNRWPVRPQNSHRTRMDASASRRFCLR